MNGKSLVKKLFSAFGLELKRKSHRNSDRMYLSDPREAFIEPNQGGAHRFRAEVSLAVDHQGFSFSPGGWHPFVSSIRNSKNDLGKIKCHLRRYYANFQPKSASDAIIGFHFAPKIFRELPPHMFYLAPWAFCTPQSVDAAVSHFVRKENLENNADLTLADGGFPTYGPVSEEKLDVEAGRLARVTRSLQKNGYLKSRGTCNFRVLKAGREIRLVIDGGGYHRLSAAAALSLECVPGDFFPHRAIIDVDDVDLWPNVRSGLWLRQEAVKYVEHLFGHDSAAWAMENDFLPNKFEQNANDLAEKELRSHYGIR